ncbi:MAG: type VI secretion system baseplate subunit TssF [Polyangiaceae bacterium]|nr:type VI secretion system baseplate subunit TssF [Polyangiaceae bacterium]
MASLLEDAAGFAEANPALAGALGAPSMDPQVERFRQGLFYLGDQLREQSHRLEGEDYRALAELVSPDLSRPIPAATIVEFSGVDGAVKVPAGLELRAPNGCIFRLVSEVETGPFCVRNARAMQEGLEFELATTGNMPLGEAVANSLRLYVDGPRESALALVEHVLRHAAEIHLRVEGARPIKLGSVRPHGFRDALAPEPDGPPTGAQFLPEYFLLPQKFSFFVVEGIRSALGAARVRKAKISIRFSAPLTAPVTLDSRDLHAHCAPATNLFRGTSEPRVVDPTLSSFPIRIADFADASVYAVTRVMAAPRTTSSGSSILVPPLHRFAAMSPPSHFPYAYSTQRVTLRGRTEPDLLLSLSSPRGARPSMDPHVLMLDLWGTNRDRSSELRPGEPLDHGEHGLGIALQARAVVGASPYVPPPSGAAFALHALTRAVVPRGDVYASLLSLIHARLPRRGIEPSLLRANLARVEAVKTAHVSVVSANNRHGYRASLAIDESAFRGIGDVGLFVRVVHAVLDAQASVNRFYECEVQCRKSGIAVRWPPEQRQ